MTALHTHTLRHGTNRRQWLGAASALVADIALAPRLAQAGAPIAVEVWKDPNCGCCKVCNWRSHLECTA